MLRSKYRELLALFFTMVREQGARYTLGKAVGFATGLAQKGRF